MHKIHVVFHDAGGGHRNAATALQAIVAQQGRNWDVRLVHFQELTDSLDVLRKFTGIRIQEQYNVMLRKGWTLGSVYVLRLLQATIRLYRGKIERLLENFWRENPADMVVSVIPHFNREIGESWNRVYPGRPFVTLITDLADFPPHFWIEPLREQYVIAGTERAAEQARTTGHDDEHIFRTSGMILRPDFYRDEHIDVAGVRRELGLSPDAPTAIVLFGGQGSNAMYEIAKGLDATSLRLQLILICGRNEKLEAKMRARKWGMRVKVIGFTKEIPELMRASDFLIGKPGPGSIAEAMVCGLPVLIECNAWTLPQERYNAEWVAEKRVGIVLKSFREVVEGARQMMNGAQLAEFRENTTAQASLAIFEIPEILEKLLRKRETATETETVVGAAH